MTIKFIRIYYNSLYICSSKNLLHMTNKFSTYIRVKTRSLILENFTPAECAKIFDVEYRNMCAYIKGRKEIPINLCFDILEYLGAKIVIFKAI